MSGALRSARADAADNRSMASLGWSEGVGRAVPRAAGLPRVSAEVAIARMDQDGDGRVDAAERDAAIDRFVPGMERAHSTAVRVVTAARAELDAAHAVQAQSLAAERAWSTVSTVASIVGAVAGLGMLVSSAVPILWAIFLVLAILGGIGLVLGKIAELVVKHRREDADAALARAQAEHDAAWEALAATLPPRPTPSAATPHALRTPRAAGVRVAPGGASRSSSWR
jgi:hypothetical protein